MSFNLSALRSLASSKKILLFGLVGAAGALIGWGLGEMLLWKLPPGKTAQAPGTPSLVFNQELTARLQREGAKTGDVQISLMWNNPNDLDLHCVDPSGEQIYFQHKKSNTSGELDVDMNARPPYSSVPVENIYWAPNRAPGGHYMVYVNHFANHGGDDPTDFRVGVKVQGKVQEFTGRISRGEPMKLVYEFDIAGASLGALMPAWYESLVVAMWTAVLAMFISLSLVVMQNRYLHRPLLSLEQAGLAIGGGFLAGCVAGMAGQMLFDYVSRVDVLVGVGRIAGWTLLGALLGKGMGLFIPNLSGARAAIAGAVGGLIGALVFALASWLCGDSVARLGGALFLGFSIGSMVALVELAFREAWLEVVYGPHEIRSINLGCQPVSIGSDRKSCTVFVRNAPPIAFSYKLDQGKILCKDFVSQKLSAVLPGDNKSIGGINVTVCAPGQRIGFVLRLSNGSSVLLADGQQLTNKDLPGLDAQVGDAVARVSHHPTQPSVFGLKNLSRMTWVAVVSGGDKVQIRPGQSIKLAPGNKINFGPVVGEVCR